MARMALALAAWTCLVSVAAASMSAGKRSLPLFNEAWPQRNSLLRDRLREQARMESVLPEFAVTEQTEILLNGQPCEYARVPSQARIEHMEVAADKKTVLRIEFRVGK